MKTIGETEGHHRNKFHKASLKYKKKRTYIVDTVRQGEHIFQLSGSLSLFISESFDHLRADDINR